MTTDGGEVEVCIYDALKWERLYRWLLDPGGGQEEGLHLGRGLSRGPPTKPALFLTHHE